MPDLAIERVEALACSVPLKHAVQQGLGQAVKRDTVLVKVTTAGGLTGYGESYNGRAPLAVTATVNTTLRDLFTGMDATATVAVWDRFESRVLANHGTCAGCVCAMSGIDMALWDIKGKALGLPLYRLLGGSAAPIAAYAGGFALGYADPAALAEEALASIAAGYRAVKLRLGDTVPRDIERTTAMRAAVGEDVALLADANCRYTVDDVRAVLPVLTQARAGWLEEPFPPYQDRRWRAVWRLAGRSGPRTRCAGRARRGPPGSRSRGRCTPRPRSCQRSRTSDAARYAGRRGFPRSSAHRWQAAG